MKRLLAVIGYIFFSCTDALAADASFDIVKGVFVSPKLVVESYGDGSLASADQSRLDTMITSDIKVSDHFALLATDAKPGFDAAVDAGALAKKGAQILVKYKTYKSAQGIKLDAKFYDLSKTTQPTVKHLSISSLDRYPFLAHKLAIELNGFVGAPPIEWMDRFVVFSKNIAPKQSQIVIADYTLSYQKTLISGGYNIFPKWASKNQQAIYYTAYEGKMVLYKFDIYSGKKSRIVSSDGMLTCSDVSSDEKKLLLTMAPTSLPDIYLYDLQSGSKKNLTNFSGIDVNGNFVDSDRKIAFVSDRLGYPSVFMKAMDSSAVEQLVIGGKNTSFHAHDDLVVYSGRENSNAANLYLLSIKNGAKKQLTAGGINSSPKFTGVGEAVMFLKNDAGRTYLGIVRLGSGAVFLFPMSTGKIKSFDW